MRLYGYTDRFGGLECLKKTSDCFGVSLRGSTSSFLKQAERRLQRGTREKEEVKASDFVCSHQLNTETPSYLHDHSEKEQNAWEAIPAPSSPPSFKISQRGLPKIFKKKWEKAVVVNQNHQNHLYNLKKKKIPRSPRDQAGAQAGVFLTGSTSDSVEDYCVRVGHGASYSAWHVGLDELKMRM